MYSPGHRLMKVPIISWAPHTAQEGRSLSQRSQSMCRAKCMKRVRSSKSAGRSKRAKDAAEASRTSLPPESPGRGKGGRRQVSVLTAPCFLQSGGALSGPSWTRLPMGRDWSSSIFHRPKGWDGRSRDICPLPCLEELQVSQPRVCRSVSRRVRANAHITGRINMATRALSSLFFGGGDRFPRRSVRSLDGLPLCQQEAIKGIVKRVRRFGKPPRDASCQGALSALRAPASGYENPCLRGRSLEWIWRPVFGGILLCDYENWLLQDTDAWAELAESAAKVRPYNDPNLHNRESYVAFLKHLCACGVPSQTSCCREPTTGGSPPSTA